MVVLPSHSTMCDFFLCGFVEDNIYFYTVPTTLLELRKLLGKALWTLFSKFGENGKTAWISAVPHVEHTSNAFKIEFHIIIYI